MGDSFSELYTLLCKYNSFSLERLCTWSHFESEGFYNTELAYCPFVVAGCLLLSNSPISYIG